MNPIKLISQRILRALSIVLVASAIVPPFPAPQPVQAASDLSIYAEQLAAGWQDWSWNISSNFSNHSPVHAGSNSLSVTFSQGWDGLQLVTQTPVDLTGYTTLRFWINGGSSGGQAIQFTLKRGDEICLSAMRNLTAPKNTWLMVDIPLSELGTPATANTLVFFNNSGNAQSTFYLDDITFLAGTTSAAPAPTAAGPVLSINAGTGKHTISTDIYGMNYADEALAQELKLPVRRWGGNSTTRYNFKLDVYNTGSDWYFENITNPVANVAALPNGSAADQFVNQDRRTGTKTLITVPMLGYVAKRRVNNHPYDCGFNTTLYGSQDSTDSWDPTCGNGVHNGNNITGNQPTDTSAAVGASFVTDWVNHLVNTFGTAANGGVAYYDLDNEPMLWNSTHRDVHPNPTSYDEMKTKTYSIAAAIKAADPSAKTLGPVVWGWMAYFWSALDLTGDYINNPPDRNAHGGVPFLDWYLQQMKAYETQNGTRILDYLDIHYYPQGSSVYSDAVDASTAALRLRSTRSLWDSTYQDESWISDKVRLIPRMHDWVNNNYPGTKTAISEYSWGAMCHINGALAQADVLGIFGREQLDMATLWGPPTSAQPGAYAFRMFRNYDGNGSMFGEQSVSASSANQDQLSVYAALRGSDAALTVMVINKTSNNLTSTVSLANYPPLAGATVYRYSGTKLNGIEQLASIPVSASGFQTTFSANSITLVVIPLTRDLPEKTYLPMTLR
jgi:hypothetical protein